MNGKAITLESFLEGIKAAKAEQFVVFVGFYTSRAVRNIDKKAIAAAKIIRRNRARRHRS